MWCFLFSSEWGGREGDCISQALRALISAVGPGYSGAPCRRTCCGVFRQRGSCHPTGVSWRQEAGRGESSKDGLSVKPGFMQQVCFSKGSGFEAFGVQQAGCKRKEGRRHSILSALDSSFFPLFIFPYPLCPALSERLTTDLYWQHPHVPPPLASAGFGYQGHQQESRGNEEGKADVFSGPSLLRALGSGRLPVPRHTHLLPPCSQALLK